MNNQYKFAIISIDLNKNYIFCIVIMNKKSLYLVIICLELIFQQSTV